MHPPQRWRLLLPGLLCTAACQGVIDDTLATKPVDQSTSSLCNSSDRGLSESRLRRLTRSEVVNTLTDLFGAELFQTSAITDELDGLPADVIVNGLDDIPEAHSDAQVGIMLRVASAVADAVVQDPTRREQLVGTCGTQSTPSEDCIRAFIASFGTRVERRPLTSDETQRLVDFYNASPGTEGLTRLLMRLAMSPALSYHVEVGGSDEATDAAGRVRLTDYEIASRIAYRATGSMPDAELMEAADAGALQDLESVKAQTRRLLATPRGKYAMEEYFRYYFQLDRAEDPLPATAASHGFDGEGFAAEAVQEMHELHDHLTWNGGSMRDLFLSSIGFARSERMAKVLGTTVMADETTPSVTSDEHLGAILHPALLVHPGARTNPMRRSSVVLRHVLCQAFGEVDPGAVSAVTDTLDYDPDTVTNREHYTRMTGGPECIVCHTRLNPVGFALEAYDQTGSFRTAETLFDDDGAETASFPIDTTVASPFGDVGEIADAPALVAAIAEHSDLPYCFSHTMFEFVRRRESERTDACAMADIEAQTEDTGSILETFVTNIANEDIFWKAGGPL